MCDAPKVIPLKNSIMINMSVPNCTVLAFNLLVEPQMELKRWKVAMRYRAIPLTLFLLLKMFLKEGSVFPEFQT
jgi:hypothetical protein